MDIQYIITILVAILGSGALTAIINNIHDNHKKDDAERQGLMFLLAAAIREECQQHINDGDIMGEDLERLEKAWSIYHNKLNGNGFLDTYMDAVRHLPIKRVYR